MRARLLAITLLAVPACDGERDLEAEASACEEGPALRLPGVDGYLVALNAYYLQEEATRSLRRGEAEAAAVEETLAKAAALGVRAVRTNAFNDGAGVAPWLFAYDARPDAWDPYTFHWYDGTDPADPVNQYVDLVRDEAARR